MSFSIAKIIEKCYNILMRNKIVNPYFSNGRDNHNVTLKASTLYGSNVAGMNWRNTDYPYLHTHTFWEMLIVIKGKVLHTLNGKEKICSAGYVCLLRPQDKHKFEFIDKSETITICVNTDNCKSMFDSFGLYNEYFESNDELSITINNEILNSTMQNALLAQSLHKIQYEYYSLIIFNQLLIKIIEKRIQALNVYPDWLNDFLILINKPENFDKSITELSKSTPYSYSRLVVLFNKYMRTSLMDYIKKVKMTYAKYLISNTDKSMLEISFDLGYTSVSTFNHNFKAFVGISPLQYRKVN